VPSWQLKVPKVQTFKLCDIPRPDGWNFFVVQHWKQVSTSVSSWMATVIVQRSLQGSTRGAAYDVRILSAAQQSKLSWQHEKHENVTTPFWFWDWLVDLTSLFNKTVKTLAQFGGDAASKTCANYMLWFKLSLVGLDG
jgi:hypothetical protein